MRWYLPALTGTLDYRLLGPFEVYDGESRLALASSVTWGTRVRASCWSRMREARLSFALARTSGSR